MTDLTDFFGEPIAVYSVADALADGVLVDAGPIAAELFGNVPVLLTATVWDDCVAWAEEDSERTHAFGQSETGRLWDVLWMTFCAARRNPDALSCSVQLYRIRRDVEPATEPAPDLVTVKATASCHDDGRPTVVISFPEED